MSREENIKTAMALIDSFNAHDLSQWYETLADDYTASYPGARGLSKKQAREYNQPFISGFPDIHFDVHQTLVDGDHVVIRWTASGTHTEPLTPRSAETIPPTGKTVSVPVAVITEVKNGQIVSEWTGWDQVELMTQLGLMPSA